MFTLRFFVGNSNACVTWCTLAYSGVRVNTCVVKRMYAYVCVARGGTHVHILVKLMYACNLVYVYTSAHRPRQVYTGPLMRIPGLTHVYIRVLIDYTCAVMHCAMRREAGVWPFDHALKR